MSNLFSYARGTSKEAENVDTNYLANSGPSPKRRAEFKCAINPECTLTFATAAELFNHTGIHTQLFCHSCGKKCDSREDFFFHRVTAHQLLIRYLPKITLWDCGRCEMRFESPCDWWNHREQYVHCTEVETLNDYQYYTNYAFNMQNRLNTVAQITSDQQDLGDVGRGTDQSGNFMNHSGRITDQNEDPSNENSMEIIRRTHNDLVNILTVTRDILDQAERAQNLTDGDSLNEPLDLSVRSQQQNEDRGYHSEQPWNYTARRPEEGDPPLSASSSECLFIDVVN